MSVADSFRIFSRRVTSLVPTPDENTTYVKERARFIPSLQPVLHTDSPDDGLSDSQPLCDAPQTINMETDHHESSTTAQLQSVRKDPRKVPGGFGIDDFDDLSPVKPNFLQNATWTNASAHALNSNRIPSLEPTSLVTQPGNEGSSLFSRTGDGEHSEGHIHSLDESAMRRHLMDIESSFLPALSPVGGGSSHGLDDTYLFDGAHQSRKRSPVFKLHTGTHAIGADASSDLTGSPPTPPAAYHTPAPQDLNYDAEDSTFDRAGNTTSSLETMSSSPTAAAAARTVSRAISTASLGGYETARDTYSSHASSQESDHDSEHEMTPKKPKLPVSPIGDSSHERPTVGRKDSDSSLRRFAADAGSTPGVALLNRQPGGRRPKFLRSRHASQRSSASSFMTNGELQDDQLDMTYGADYALQSGGAVPEAGMSREVSQMLSRKISLGSMASGIEDSTEGRNGDRSLASLDEEDRNRGKSSTTSKETDSTDPATPRMRNATLTAPTDTVIAHRVRNVQVPESIAREYRDKSASGRYSGISAPSLGRNGKNMTLKEQSSTIERLSKENFDLKLKVMFLSDRLDKLSEEGVKEMISENVELKTGLANLQRDNKALKRKIRELEQRLGDEEGRPRTARSGTSSDARYPYEQEGAQERDEELLYLRERVEEYVTEIEKMRNDSLVREAEKRKLAEVVRNMGEKRGEQFDAREEMDVWKDLLEQETARREEADEDNRKLRDEIFRLKSDTSSSSGVPGLNHTTNIYNITKKRQLSPSRPRSELSERVEDRNAASSAASTLVEELRRESEQLRHENAELRREVGAQTSMLTSRNREKERLYQEIEDLKLGQRRGDGSIAGDSIFERSASRAHERSLSRSSVLTKQSALMDPERDDFENKNAELRDKINALKLQNQELQRELEACMEDFEIAAEAKKEAETLAAELQEELETAESDLQTMQADRDEALKANEDLEIEFENLRQEAQDEIDALEAEAEQKQDEFQRLQADLSDRTENFDALQVEMRAMSEGLVRLEDEHDSKLRRIQEVEHDLQEANRELEDMEKTLVEANKKVNRLTVQQESSQGEIAFLREEQDGDKIKIGDLESALKTAQESVRDDRERVKELEQRLVGERQQREHVAGKEKQELQKFINELNREASAAKDEARRLRKSLTSREVEATEWKERLMELENNLREALGDLNGTRSSLLKSIAKLQRELENTVRELETAKASMTEKDRVIQQRDSLLESHGLESRRLAEMLDKERQSHRNTKNQHETFLKTHQHTTRTVSQQEARVQELEAAQQQYRKKFATLENNFKDQMTERNNLLLALWNRLSALCGTDWTHDNSLINGRALPSLEAVSTMLPGFSKNLLFAVKTIETLVGSFKSRIQTVEKDLWKEYHNLENTLDLRTKKLDRLETVVKASVYSTSPESRAEIAQLREANRSMKEELMTLQGLRPRSRNAPPVESPSPSPSVPTGPRNKVTERTSTLTRHPSMVTSDSVDRLGSLSSSQRNGSGNANDVAGEQRWIYRLRELERRLKAEREARLLDRSGARKRLEEGERRNEELRAELERNRVRKEAASGS